jgi:putative transposase
MNKTLTDIKRSMDDYKRLSKNASIARSMKMTRERRRHQTCNVFNLKIQTNKLNKTQKEQLKMMFVEAKWLRNDVIAKGLDGYRIQNEVDVKLPDKTVSRKFRYLSAQMKQSVVAEVKQNIKALSTKKKHGGKVGKLRFVSNVSSINLQQANRTYKIKNNKARIQKVGGWVHVNGAEQIHGYELANAHLLNKPDGYYLAVTCFRDKQKEDFVDGSAIGIDMGVKTHITLSNGIKIKTVVGETEHLRRLHKKLSRQTKGSNGYRKNLDCIHSEYRKLTNKKNNIANQVVHYLLQHEHVCMQDENISSWRMRKSIARGSKGIRQSILGRVKAKLIANQRTIVLDKWQPTTKMCICGKKNGMPLSARTYSCDCGYHCDRDVHAARNMIRFAEQSNQIPMECRDFKPVESLLDAFESFSNTQDSMKLEASESLTQK